ncbi:sulfatase [Sesbania bispinosa]|nr:sulfatase [Sesbania bispinosa]
MTLNQTSTIYEEGKGSRSDMVSWAGQNYSARQMLFGTELRLESGQVLGEFVPVLRI